MDSIAHYLCDKCSKVKPCDELIEAEEGFVCIDCVDDEEE